MLIHIKKLFLATALLALAACSSSGDRMTLVQQTEGITPGAIAALEVVASPDEDSQSAATELRGRLFGSLVANGIFGRIVSVSEPADYDLQVLLNNVDEVSLGATLFLGVFAGSDEAEANVTLTNRRNGNIVVQFQATGEGAAHPLSSERGMDSALRELDRQIVQGLQ